MTREEAIQYAEDKLGKGLYRLDLGYLNRGLYQIVAREVDFMVVAISALREQEERSKGCEFCKGAKYIYGELSASGHADDDHDFVHEQYGDFPICAMCGRRLEEV